MSQLVEQESLGFSAFNTAPFQLFKTMVNEESFASVEFYEALSALESTSIDLAHQVGNSLLGRIFESSNKLLDALSPLYKNHSKPIQVRSRVFEFIESGLDSYTDLNSVLVELNNYESNLRLISQQSTNDVFLILNAIEIGDQSAIIQNIDDQLAYLVPVIVRNLPLMNIPNS